MSDATPVLCLASASPRRRELLLRIGVPHHVVVADVDETQHGQEPAEEYVGRVALAKARAVWARGAERRLLPVLAADTTVVLDGRILGKPSTEAEGVAMLGALGGRTHRVLTAVVLLTGETAAPGVRHRLVATEVSFRPIDAAEAAHYWATGEPRDKAGGYAVQGYGAIFVAGLAGSYSGVMGLPLFETAELLRAAGIAVWAGPAS